MKLQDLTALVQAQAGTAGFPMFKDAGLVVCVAVPTLGTWATKKIKALEMRAKTEAGATAMVWLKCEDLAAGKVGADSLLLVQAFWTSK
jgi:tartrate dehydratase beta subunit/fumarate hydratase class I family protein